MSILFVTQHAIIKEVLGSVYMHFNVDSFNNALIRIIHLLNGYSIILYVATNFGHFMGKVLAKL